jgi:hypothetical protein
VASCNSLLVSHKRDADKLPRRTMHLLNQAVRYTVCSAATRQDVNVDNPTYFCKFLTDGLYDVFYPSNKANLGAYACGITLYTSIIEA